MGLSIGKYSHSYMTLQKLRAFALKIDGMDMLVNNTTNMPNYDEIEKILDNGEIPTRFLEFVWHTDCDGGYISYSYFGIKEFRDNTLTWGDLDKLKKECLTLKEHLQEIQDEKYRTAMEDFISDVDDASVVLQFN